MPRPRTILEGIRVGEDFLRRHGTGRARLEAELLLSHILGKERLQLYLEADSPLGEGDIPLYRDLLMRRKRGEPMSYITGDKEFLSIRFLVGRGVFIPRPETETLVEEVIRRVGGEGGLFVDVGCGSCAIAVSIVKNSAMRGIGTDISREALFWARRNVALHDLSDRISLIEADLLSPFRPGATVFDLVISNPPYIPEGEIPSLMKDVRDFEPGLALSGGGDGLDFIRRLVRESPEVLKRGGLLAFEFGSGQAGAVREITMESGGFSDPEILKDLCGEERAAICRRD